LINPQRSPTPPATSNATEIENRLHRAAARVHPLHHVGTDHRRQRKDRADGNVDPTGDDDERLPDGHDRVDRHVRRDLTDQIIEVEEGVRPAVRIVRAVCGEDQSQDQDDDEQARFLHTGQADARLDREGDDFRRRGIR
jgi:hypothetical protein